eukprot:m.917575 g.917575  ORF g.917575 m.917575 type:complete len:129 (+) comp23738_c0_seq80:840-1226(+)
MQGRAPLYCADHTIETNGKIMRLHATQTYCSGSEPNERCRGSSSHTRATVPPNRRIGEFSARTVHGNVRVFAECAGVPDSTPVREQNSSPAGTSGHIRKVTRSPVNVGVFFLITRPTTYVASGNVYLQ